MKPRADRGSAHPLLDALLNASPIAAPIDRDDAMARRVAMSLLSDFRRWRHSPETKETLEWRRSPRESQAL